MTEDEARRWIAAHVPRETEAQLARFIELLLAEMPRQNLIAASTTDQLWARHIVDSAQLLALAPDSARRWIDLGAGAGFPGIVVALARSDIEMTLVESRRKRIDFLRHVVEQLGIGARVTVAGRRLEMLESAEQDVISARAFAPLEKLLSLGTAFSTQKSLWLLPKGRNAEAELAALDPTWQGEYRLEPSVTDAEAQIIVASGVRRAAPRRVGKDKRR